MYIKKFSVLLDSYGGSGQGSYRDHGDAGSRGVQKALRMQEKEPSLPKYELLSFHAVRASRHRSLASFKLKGEQMERKNYSQIDVKKLRFKRSL